MASASACPSMHSARASQNRSGIGTTAQDFSVTGFVVMDDSVNRCLNHTVLPLGVGVAKAGYVLCAVLMAPPSTPRVQACPSIVGASAGAADATGRCRLILAAASRSSFTRRERLA